MAVRQTSLRTYREIRAEGLVNRMEELVFNTIYENPGRCDREYAEMAGLSINQWTGRRNDLMKKGFVASVGQAKDYETNRTVLLWSVNTRHE